MTVQKPFFVVPYDLGTITTGNERAEKPAAHLNQFKHIGMVWGSSGAASVWVRCNLGSAKAIDFVSMVSANAIPATTWRVRIGDTQAEVDGTADYDSTAVAFISPSITRTDGLYVAHLELPSTQTKQWIRIDIGSHTGDFECSALIVGKKITPTRYYSPDYKRGVEDMGDVDIGRYGVPAETPGRIMRTLGFTLGWITGDEYDTDIGPMLETVGKRTPIFCCFDPEATVYRQRKTYFGWLKEPGYATGAIMPGNYAQDFEFLSMI